MPYDFGIHPNMPMAEYVGGALGDGGEYALSRGNLRDIVKLSPLHAKMATDKSGNDATRASDLGTVVHDICLQGVKNIVWIDAPDYRTKKAQELRDAARAKNKTPMLERERSKVTGMVDAIMPELEKFGALKTEHTLLWRDERTDILCRSRPDALSDDYSTVIDLKTTSNASPEAYSKIIYSEWHDVQAAHAAAGIGAITGVAPTEWVWIVCESEAPYCVSVIYASELAIEAAHRRRDAALNRWRDCLAKDEWPGFEKLHYLTVPDWVAEQILREESRL